MSDPKKRPPIVIELDNVEAEHATPADAPPVPDPQLPRSMPAMEIVTGLAARKPSRLLQVFLMAVTMLVSFVISVALWDFAADLLSRNIWLGRAALALLAITAGAVLLIGLRELAALSRLRKIDGLRATAVGLQVAGTLEQTHAFSRKLAQLYKTRADLRWGLAELAEQREEMLDPDALLTLTETKLLAPLDRLATQQIESAARQVATATALIPLAFADVIVAFTANIRMIRQIAQIYGGRSGGFGAWRLIRAVAGHLVATGAVAVGDDLIGSIAGGGVLSKLSRRFGEGLINGALTARVGIAAMEVCRPMPFKSAPRPSVTQLVKRALTGLFS